VFCLSDFFGYPEESTAELSVFAEFEGVTVTVEFSFAFLGKLTYDPLLRYRYSTWLWIKLLSSVWKVICNSTLTLVRFFTQFDLWKIVCIFYQYL